MTNIKQLAANFNAEHGRAMTYEEALSLIRINEAVIFSKDVAELYAESARQDERNKVIDIAIQAFSCYEPLFKTEIYLVIEYLESLKSKPWKTKPLFKNCGTDTTGLELPW